jgi:hypothetical protein
MQLRTFENGRRAPTQIDGIHEAFKLAAHYCGSLGCVLNFRTYLIHVPLEDYP